MSKRECNSDLIGAHSKKSKIETTQTMNLNSLPDELMVRILKRKTYATILGLRKMDSRIDRIANNFDVGVRLPVVDVHFLLGPACANSIPLRIRFEVNGSTLNLINQSLNKRLDENEFVFKTEQTDSFKQFERFLSKIQIYGQLFLRSNDIPTDEHLITVFRNQKRCLRNISSLAINTDGAYIEWSKKSVQQLLTNCPKLRNIYVSAKISCLESFCQALVGRPWKSLALNESWRSHSLPEALNIEFLRKVTKNCLDFSFRKEKLWQFNISELLDFIEDCVKEKNFFTSQKWDFFQVPAGNFTKAEILNRLEKIEEIKYAALGSQFRPSTRFKITLPAHPEVQIEFDIMHQMQE